MVDRLIFGFLWNYKVECVSRKTLFHSPDRGGLGVTNIRAKLDSFLCVHLGRLVGGPYAMWQEAAAYWVGLRVDGARAEFRTNARPHTLTATEFYDAAVRAYRRLKSARPDVDMNSVSTKTVYAALMTDESQTPVVEAKYPTIDFTAAWKTANNNRISPRPRDLGWQIVHTVLPVHFYLYSLNITKILTCPLCQADSETLQHLFLFCPIVRPVWLVLDGWLSAIWGKRFVSTARSVLFYQMSGIDDADIRTLVAVTSAELKFSIWTARNRAKFENKLVTSDALRKLFTYAVKSRIQADHIRLDEGAFADLWCRAGVLADVGLNDGLYIKI